MKNLKIYSAITTEGNAEIVKEIQGARKMCIDSLNGIIYFAVGSTKLVAVNRHMELVNIMKIPQEEIGTDAENPIMRFDSLSDDHKLCLVYQRGQIITIDIEEQKVKKLCELGKNIAGCSWSPDLQLLVIGTETDLFMLTRNSNSHESGKEFKIFTESSLRPASSGKDQLITIGWGSAETQFQGTAGKHNRAKQDPNKLPMAIRGEFDDKRVLISWRADGQFFTVSSVDEILVPKQLDSPGKNIAVDKVLCRQIRVWNRDLEFIAQCEFLTGIEPALCMRPTGNLIAVPRVTDKDRYIWFFERNGQYRNKFLLPAPKLLADSLSSQTVIRQIGWNLDATVFHVHIFNKESQQNQLQFWTVSNYSWMEKLRLNVDQLVEAFWDQEMPLKFHYLTTAGHYKQILLQFEYTCEDLIVLSVNGGNVRVTDFKLGTIPPPMCHYSLDLYHSPPSAFAFSPQFGLAIVQPDYQQITTYNLVNRKFTVDKMVGLVTNSSLLYNLAWCGANSLLACRNGKGAKETEIVRILLDSEEIIPLRSVNLQVYAQFVVRSPPFIDWTKAAENSLLLQHQTLKLDDGDVAFLVGVPFTLAAEQSYRFKLMEVEKQTLLFTLTNTYCLYVNNKKIDPTIGFGSFVFNDAYLVVQSLSNNVNCFKWERVHTFLAENAGTKSSIFEEIDERSAHPTDRGANLIACESGGTRVWLQMQRGNLELINPRELVVNNLKRLIDAEQWRDAFLQMRRHRVDLNLLYDHNPEHFMDHINQFVRQIDDIDHLNIFLTSITPNDSTRTQFAPQYPERSSSASKTSSDAKVNRICERMRSTLATMFEEGGGSNSADGNKRKMRFYPVLLTTFVMEKPSKLTAALNDMRKTLTQLNGESSPQTVHRWLNHISYLVDWKELFKHAMKTYDLEIALMVAQSTNMDPKEYLPILNGLREKTPETYQKFHIDVFLRDWHSAVEHICQLVQQDTTDTFLEECLRFVDKYGLHRQALVLFAGKPHYEKICLISAKHLDSISSTQEAAIFYEKAGDFQSALDCLQKYHLHADAEDDEFDVSFMRVAKKAGVSQEELKGRLQKLAEEMTQKRHWVSAAKVLSLLGKEKNAEKIMDCFAKAGAWRKMVNFLHECCQNADDELFNRARVLLSHRSTQVLERIDEWRDAINKHSARLEQLRERKAERIRQIVDMQNEGLEPDMETTSISSTNSNCSVNSRHSAKTSKRKTMQRKKLHIKEGSQWEDAAILVELKHIYGQLHTQQDEMHELLPALVSMDLVDKGTRLQAEMIQLDRLAHFDKLRVIWPDHLEPHHLVGPITDIYHPDNEIQPKYPISTDWLMPSRVHIRGPDADELERPKQKPTSAHYMWNQRLLDKTETDPDYNECQL